MLMTLYYSAGNVISTPVLERNKNKKAKSGEVIS